mmetsp:Transcript_9094/g.22486  ORF Transcript_9094/g.22486 Transcript_9094/m.22486 type:complete len:325 (+) Transcript_9094:1123-2097(+)
MSFFFLFDRWVHSSVECGLADLSELCRVRRRGLGTSEGLVLLPGLAIEEVLAGELAGFRGGGQPDHGVRAFLFAAKHPPHHRKESLHILGLPQPFGIHPPWVARVHTDPVVLPLRSKDVREHHPRPVVLRIELNAAVRCRLRLRPSLRAGRFAAGRRPGAPRKALLDRRQVQLGREHARGDHVHHPRVRRRLEEILEFRREAVKSHQIGRQGDFHPLGVVLELVGHHRGVVDEDVEPGVGPAEVAGEGTNLVGLAEVHDVELHLPSRAVFGQSCRPSLDAVERGGAPLLAPAEHVHRGPAARQLAGRRPPDAGVCPRHDSCFPR